MAPSEQRTPHRSAVPGALLLAFGILVSIVGMGVVTAGILATSANQLRGSDGYIAAPTETFTTQSYALTSPGGDIRMAPGMQNVPFDLATVRLSATSTDSAVFIGIAPKADIDHYLDHVKRTEIRNIRYFPFEVDYRDLPGSHAPAPPTDQHFWTKSAAGPGTQEIQ